MTDHQIVGGDAQVGWASMPSAAHRGRNEDAFFAMPERGFFGVFDGMGGHAAADLAARIAADEVQDVLVPLAPAVPPEVVADTLRDALFAADAGIRAAGDARGDGRGMGASAVVAVIRRAADDLWSAMVGWAGDSRALVLHAGSLRLETLTLDDGVVRLHGSSAAQARKVQAVLGDVTDPRQLTTRERDYFLERNVIIQAVGTSLRHVHITEHALGEGDQLLLSTDGVHDNLTDAEISALLRRAPSPKAAAEQIVHAARARSLEPEHARAKPDDVTTIVVRLG